MKRVKKASIWVLITILAVFILLALASELIIILAPIVFTIWIIVIGRAESPRETEREKKERQIYMNYTKANEYISDLEKNERIVFFSSLDYYALIRKIKTCTSIKKGEIVAKADTVSNKLYEELGEKLQHEEFDTDVLYFYDIIHL